MSDRPSQVVDRAIFKQMVSDMADEDNLPTDNEGQIVIYTSVYLWRDGKMRDYPDPDWDRFVG